MNLITNLRGIEGRVIGLEMHGNFFMERVM